MVKYRNLLNPITDLHNNVLAGTQQNYHGFCPWFDEIMRISLYSGSQAQLMSFAEMK